MYVDSIQFHPIVFINSLFGKRLTLDRHMLW